MYYSYFKENTDTGLVLYCTALRIDNPGIQITKKKHFKGI